MLTKELSYEEASRLLRYDPQTGYLYWKVGRPKAAEGARAGCAKGGGYWVVRVHGVRFRAYRLAWLLTYGNWPLVNIDHINGDPSDNRLSNLRECTQYENSQNSKSRVGSGSKYVGVHWEKQTGKWRARIKVLGVVKSLGRFGTEDDAASAYAAAKAKYHTFNPEVVVR